MQNTVHLLRERRFLPLFVTQFLGAMNDNLFKNAMVLFVVYNVYSDPKQEEQFSAIASTLFVIPFFLLSAVAGQLADARDKAKLVRIVKLAEIGIMIVGAAGLLLANIPMMLVALVAMARLGKLVVKPAEGRTILLRQGNPVRGHHLHQPLVLFGVPSQVGEQIGRAHV